MTVRLELKPDVEANLTAQARARGVSLDAYLQTVIEDFAQAQATNPTHQPKDVKATDHSALKEFSDFFEAKSIDRLIIEQGIHPIENVEVLSGAIPDEDIDELISDIYRDREARG